MTDQELADAIREKFDPRMMDGSWQLAKIGAALRDFCRDHPAWKLEPGKRVWWSQIRANVTIIGPDPNDPGQWVVARPSGSLTYAPASELEPAHDE